MFNPLADRVLVFPDPKEESINGIILPDSARKNPPVGEVVAVGPNCTISVGDKVHYGEYSGSPLTYDGKEYLIMRESEIFGIL